MLKKGLRVVTALMTAAVILLAVLLAGVRVLGLQVCPLLSEDMEPAYRAGSVLYVRETDCRTLGEGDVITFLVSDNAVVTRRIAGVVPDAQDPTVLRFRIKADANAAEDSALVHYRNVLGTPVLAIPGLGYVAAFLQTPQGLRAAVGFGAVLILLVLIPAFTGSGKEKKRKHHSGKGGRYLRG